MTEETKDADDDTSRSFVKDLDNIRRQDFLLQVDLEDPDIAREHWIGLRSKTMERFGLALMFDPLWDYAANLKGDEAKFDEKVELKNYRGYGTKIGHPRDMQTISQKTLRFRAIAMIKAHLPSGIEWFTEISTLSDDQSVFSWYAHNDLVYLSVDRDDELNAQTDFLSLHWRKNVPMRAFWKKFREFQSEFDRVSPGEDMTPDFVLDQYEIAIITTDPRNPADGYPYFKQDFKDINADVAKLNRQLKHSDIVKFKNKIDKTWKQLVQSKVLSPDVTAVVNATYAFDPDNFSSSAAVRLPVVENAKNDNHKNDKIANLQRQIQNLQTALHKSKTKSPAQPYTPASSSTRSSKKSRSGLEFPRIITTDNGVRCKYLIPIDEFDKMSFEDQNMAATKWVFHHGFHNKLPHYVDRSKGVCRFLRPPEDGSDGPKQPCLEHHDPGERCPHTTAAFVHATQLEWNMHLATQTGTVVMVYRQCLVTAMTITPMLGSRSLNIAVALGVQRMLGGTYH